MGVVGFWKKTRKDKEELKQQMLRKITPADFKPVKTEEAGVKEEKKLEEEYKSVLKLVPGVNGEYVFPPLNLLEDPPSSKAIVSLEELNQTAKALKETLGTFGIEVEEDRIEKYPGPIITRFEFKPVAGIKVNQVV